MVAADGLQLHHLLAFLERARSDAAQRIDQSGTLEEFLRRKPCRVRHATDDDVLLEIEQQKFRWNILGARSQLAIRLGDDLVVADAGEPKDEEALHHVWNLKIRLRSEAAVTAPVTLETLEVRIRSHAEERRLHRAGGNLERLRDERADGHRYRNRHQQHLHVLADRRLRIRPQPGVGDLLQFRHAGFHLRLVRPGAQRATHLRDGFVDLAQGLGGEQIALCGNKLPDVLPHVRCLTRGGGEKPVQVHEMMKRNVRFKP